MKKFFLILGIFFLVNMSCFAQEQTVSNELSLQEAIDLSLSKNLNVQNTRLNVDRAKNDIKIANRLQNPSLETYNNIGAAGRGNAQELGVSQVIEIGKRGARKKLAKLNFSLSQDKLKFSEFNLRMDIRQAYVQLVAAKSALKILQEQQHFLEELLKIAQKRYNEGAAPEMDVIHAKITLNQLITEVNTARTDVVEAKLHFNKVLNLKDDKTLYDTKEDYLPVQNEFVFLLTPKPKNQMPKFENISNLVSSKRLDIKIANQEVDAARKNLSVVMRQRIPDLTVGGGYIFVPKSQSDSGHLDSGIYLAGGIVNIPLLYNYSPEIKNAKIQLEQAILARDSLQNTALKDAQASYEKFVTAKLNLNYYNNQLLADSSKFLKMSQKSYENGKTNLTDLIFIEQSYQSIMLGYTNALADYYNYWIDFLKQVNDEGFVPNEEHI